MSSSYQASKRRGSAGDATLQHDPHVLSYGQLSMLASFCPLHRNFPAQALGRLFIPAINFDCVRFFANDQDQVCAALIWARLSDEVSERMVFDQVPPREADWVSGTNLWFLDILAPFGHGKMVARHIARNPPEGPFYFARLGKKGKARKIVRGNAGLRRGRVRSYMLDHEQQEG